MGTSTNAARRWRRPERCTLALGGVPIVTSLGCSSVLGIEPAELDPAFSGAVGSSGGSGQMASSAAGASATTRIPLGTLVPVSSCDAPSPACGDCIADCPDDALPRCLADFGCRRALDRYRKCLGSNCADDGERTCIEQALRDTALSETLAMCLVSRCDTSCTGSTVTSVCALHCACMSDHCSDDGAGGQAAAFDENQCVTECLAGGQQALELAYCRWDHCEFSFPEAPAHLRASHCAHARGVGFCENPPAIVAECPASTKYAGFACDADDECCSNNCVDQVCQD